MAFIITQINLRAGEFLVHFFKRVRKSLKDWQMQPHLKPHSVPPGLEQDSAITHWAIHLYWQSAWIQNSHAAYGCM